MDYTKIEPPNFNVRIDVKCRCGQRVRAGMSDGNVAVVHDDPGCETITGSSVTQYARLLGRWHAEQTGVFVFPSGFVFKELSRSACLCGNMIVFGTSGSDGTECSGHLTPICAEWERLDFDTKSNSAAFAKWMKRMQVN